MWICCSTTASTPRTSFRRRPTGAIRRRRSRCTLPRSPGPKRLVLTHHDPSHEDGDLDRILCAGSASSRGEGNRRCLHGARVTVHRPRAGVDVGPRPGPVSRGARPLRHRHHHRDGHRGRGAGRLLVPVVLRPLAGSPDGDPGPGQDRPPAGLASPGPGRSASTFWASTKKRSVAPLPSRVATSSTGSNGVRGSRVPLSSRALSPSWSARSAPSTRVATTSW